MNPEDLKSRERESGVTRLFLGIELNVQTRSLSQESIIPNLEFFKTNSAETNLPPGFNTRKLACKILFDRKKRSTVQTKDSIEGLIWKGNDCRFDGRTNQFGRSIGSRF